MFEFGLLRALIDRRFPLADAAHAYIESRRVVGRVVLHATSPVGSVRAASIQRPGERVTRAAGTVQLDPASLVAASQVSAQ